METGLVRTASANADNGHLVTAGRRGGTVRVIGLFSAVTSRYNADASGRNTDASRRNTDASGRHTATAHSHPLTPPHPLTSSEPLKSQEPLKSREPLKSPELLTSPEPQHSIQNQDPGRGVRWAEYLLVIYPGGDLEEKLLGEQRQFSDEYAVTTRNKPHITVLVFQAAEVMEETLIRWIQRICSNYRSFDLSLNNYSGFPPHTAKSPAAGESLRIPGSIYLRVQDPEPFGQLIQQFQAIDEFIQSSGCPPANLMSRPHLSIAGGLTEQIYNKAMPDYSRKTFHETFRVRELVLLKRTHAFDPCKTVNIFRLPHD